MIYSFTIPWRLPGLNDYISALDHNRYSGAKLKKDTELGIRACIRRYMPSNLKIPYRVQVNIEFYEPNRKRDYDNIESAVKFIMDALVQERVILNDNQRHTFPPHYTHHVDPANPRVEVTIIPDINSPLERKDNENT